VRCPNARDAAGAAHGRRRARSGVFHRRPSHFDLEHDAVSGS
jgi:hypothetical protein